MNARRSLSAARNKATGVTTFQTRKCTDSPRNHCRCRTDKRTFHEGLQMNAATRSLGTRMVVLLRALERADRSIENAVSDGRTVPHAEWAGRREAEAKTYASLASEFSSYCAR